MTMRLHLCPLLICVSLTLAKKDDLQLPPCPTHLQYFPQDLPMHCRMTRKADNNQFRSPDLSNLSTLPPDDDYPFYQSPPPDKVPPPVPIPIPPYPGMPPGMLSGMPPGMLPGMPPGMLPGMPPGPGMQPGMPPAMQMTMPPGMRFMPGMPGAMPLPMPMPMPVGPPHKLPVIVMPFYSPDLRPSARPHQQKRHHKRRPTRYNSSEFETRDSDTSKDSSSGDTSDSKGSGDEGWWKGKGKGRKHEHKKYGIYRRFNRRHKVKKKESTNQKADLLTPILQYVTKDGYVIFEKRITKDEATEWLGSKEEAKVKEEEDAVRKDVEIIEEERPKIETVSEDTVIDETTKIKVRDASNSRKVNEVKEIPKPEKLRKHKKLRVRF